jgi:hypothetical protein
LTPVVESGVTITNEDFIFTVLDQNGNIVNIENSISTEILSTTLDVQLVG